MKNLRLVFLLISTLLINSCVTKPKDAFACVDDEFELKKKLMLDSVVELSCSGIVLGQPFNQTISLAKRDGKIKNIEYQLDGEDKSATCVTKIILPNREEGQDVDMKICSFQDTITSIILISEDYDSHQGIIDIYTDKYNEQLSEYEFDVEDWGDKINRAGSNSWIWTYKNQSIRVSYFYTEKRENYLKDPTMHSPENRYGIRYTKYFNMISIIYSDLYQMKKVEAFEKKINEQKKIEQARNEAIEEHEDSIRKALLNKKIKRQEI
jgi:hypothetical protein